MGLKLANNASSSLAAALTKSETLVRVLAGHGVRFPVLSEGDWFPLAAQKATGEIEYMRATARAGDVISVQRQQENSEALDFDAGDVVFLPLTVAALNTLKGSAQGITLSISDVTVTG